jgi:tyrosine-protein kinase Etk/Wzc
MSAPGVAANPAIAQHFGQLIAYQSALDSLTSGEWRRSETHPDVQRLRTRMASTEARLVNAVRGQVATLGTRVAALDQMRARSGAEISQLPQSEAEEVRLTQQVQSMQRIGDQLREEYQKARISEAVEAGQVEIVNLASRAEPVPSRRPLKLVLGLMLGLMLGTGGAFLREHMNTSIRRREDIETVLRVPGLGVIPRIASIRKGILHGAALKRLPSGNGGSSRGNGDGPHAASLIMAHAGSSPGAEAFRTIRTNVVFSQAVQTLKTLVVTSTSPGEGKTTTAANLAATFAQQQARVLLVDCDLRRPKLDQMFGVPREPGLTNVLLGQGTTRDTIRSTGVENLHVLTAGILPPNPYELLGGERMTRLLDALSDEYDILVIDTPPLMAASDAAVLGAKADGVLLVVRAGSTDRGAAQQATQQLATVGARVVGAVLNDPDATAEQYGGYYYNYSYSEHT